MSTQGSVRKHERRARADKSRPLVKLTMELEADHWLGFNSELLWGEDLGNGKYRLLNSPFAAYGVSYQDVVAARKMDADELVVESVVLRGGHSTYRVFVLNEESIEDSAFQKFWSHLEAAGCMFERATKSLLAVDVPPNADADLVYKLLENGEAAGVWEFEEAHCGHPVGCTS